MNRIDKRALVDDLRAQLAGEITVLTQAALATREGAIHEDAKPENDKDTRAIEAGYLAGAQAERVRDLEKTRALLGALALRQFAEGDAIALTAIVELTCEDARSTYFLVPAGGGMRARVAGVEVHAITPQSPLGQQLVGKTEGDDFEMTAQKRKRAYEIVGVQ